MGELNGRTKTGQILKSLRFLNKTITKEIHQKLTTNDNKLKWQVGQLFPRNLDFVHKWKATEVRNFWAYEADIILNELFI